MNEQVAAVKGGFGGVVGLGCVFEINQSVVLASGMGRGAGADCEADPARTDGHRRGPGF